MEKDSFLIVKHGDIDIPGGTYYTLNREAYNDWFDKKQTVTYTAWGTRTGYPLRPGAKVQCRWFSELNDQVKDDLKKQNKKLFDTFETAEAIKIPNKFSHIKPDEVYILDYEKNPIRLYLVRISEYHNPTKKDEDGYSADGLLINNADREWGSVNVSSCRSAKDRRIPEVYRFTSMLLETRSLFKKTNPELYQYFEQYYSKPIGPKTGSDFDIDKSFSPVSQDLMEAFSQVVTERDYERLKDPYGFWKKIGKSAYEKVKDSHTAQEPIQGAWLDKYIKQHELNWESQLPDNFKYSPNINQINNEKSNLRTTNQSFSGRKELTGSAVQSNRGKITITTGHFSNRQNLSSRPSSLRSS